jgi:radical SAM superfamily enzyme YgiQ (UPF0313 family)
MRILLCHCSSFVGNDISHPRVEHLGIGYLAASARSHGHTVTILDANIEKLIWNEALDRIRTLGDFDLIGFSVLGANYHQTRLVIAGLRALGSKAHICLGGYLPTFLCHQLVHDCPGVDSIILGEADVSFLQLAEAIEGDCSWRDVPGLAFADGSQLVSNPLPPLTPDLDRLPFPARDTLPLLFRNRNPVISISPTRGCYMKCNFCSIIQFYAMGKGRAWRERSPENVVDEIEEILSSPACRDHNADFVWFCADEFIGLKRGGKSFGQRLTEEILGRRLVFRWEIACRTDQVDFELFRLMREAGLRSVYVGVESFSQRQLDAYHKQNTVEQNCEAIRIFEKLRLDYTLGTIVFSPNTTLEEFERNHRAIESVGYHRVTMPLSRLKLFEGTPATAQHRTQALSIPGRRDEDAPSKSGNGALDPTFPLDDVYDYAFADERVDSLWKTLHNRNDANEGLVREAVRLLDDGLIDGVSFWQLVFNIRDALAWFVEDAVNSVKREEGLDALISRHDLMAAEGMRQLRDFRLFLEGNPLAEQYFLLTFPGIRWEYRVPGRSSSYIPGVEKELAERDHQQAAVASRDCLLPRDVPLLAHDAILS